MKSGNIQLRRTPELEHVLDRLQEKIRINQSAVITLAIMELAAKWGVPAEIESERAATSERAAAGKKGKVRDNSGRKRK